MNFIILFSLTSSIIYIHYQPKVSETRICFNNNNNNTNVSTNDFCKPMTITRINEVVPVFQFDLNTTNQCVNYTYFKIIYTYSNKTSFNSSWVPLKTITTPSLPVASQCFFSFCLICLSICLTSLLILIGLLVYYYYFYQHYCYSRAM